MKVYVVSLGRKYLYLQWVDPETGRRVTRSSKCKTRRDAERKASLLEIQLSSGEGSASGKIKWEEFAELYQIEHLSSLAKKTEIKAIGVLENFNREMSPASVSSVTAGVLSRYVTILRDGERSEATIAGHIRQLRAALQWAKRRGFVGTVPAMPRIQRASGTRLAKGRPITPLEFRQMLRACRIVCPEHWRTWTRVLYGLWLSGLRLGEAVALRWDRGNWPHIDIADKIGWLIIPAEFDKSHRDRTIPLPPDFDAWLRRTPEHDRTGHVFRPLGTEGLPVAFFRVSQVISAIGRESGVVTDPASGRTATAHDLRRSFAQRWASRLTPVDLQRLMRHSSITTTLGYYVDQDSEGLAKRMQSTFTQH